MICHRTTSRTVLLCALLLCQLAVGSTPARAATQAGGGESHRFTRSSAATTVTVRRNIRYGPRRRQRLDLFLPESPARRRVLIVLIHGGAFRTGDKRDLDSYARYFAARGWVAASVNYRYADGQSYRRCRDDALRSIRFLRRRRKRWSIDSRRVVVLGSSAGGNLAALAATVGQGRRDRGSRVRAAVALSPPIYMGDAYVTPTDHVDHSDAPMLLFNSTEEIVPLWNATGMRDALRAARVRRSRLIIYSGSRHAQEYILDAWDPLLRWLQRRAGRFPHRAPGT